MFEYLMPLLVTESAPRTLLDETMKGAVRRQREYGASRHVRGACPSPRTT